ncbi:Rcc1 [Symbiodinium sp. CCMP2592]|nr:Rcc1 [Symbiodinium sp. CCMP2592]
MGEFLGERTCDWQHMNWVVLLIVCDESTAWTVLTRADLWLKTKRRSAELPRKLAITIPPWKAGGAGAVPETMLLVPLLPCWQEMVHVVVPCEGLNGVWHCLAVFGAELRSGDDGPADEPRPYQVSSKQLQKRVVKSADGGAKHSLELASDGERSVLSQEGAALVGTDVWVVGIDTAGSVVFGPSQSPRKKPIHLRSRFRSSIWKVAVGSMRLLCLPVFSWGCNDDRPLGRAPSDDSNSGPSDVGTHLTTMACGVAVRHLAETAVAENSFAGFASLDDCKSKCNTRSLHWDGSNRDGSCFSFQKKGCERGEVQLWINVGFDPGFKVPLSAPSAAGDEEGFVEVPVSEVDFLHSVMAEILNSLDPGCQACGRVINCKQFTLVPASEVALLHDIMGEVLQSFDPGFKVPLSAPSAAGDEEGFVEVPVSEVDFLHSVMAEILNSLDPGCQACGRVINCKQFTLVPASKSIDEMPA